MPNTVHAYDMDDDYDGGGERDVDAYEDMYLAVDDRELQAEGQGVTRRTEAAACTSSPTPTPPAGPSAISQLRQQEVSPTYPFLYLSSLPTPFFFPTA